MKNVKFLSDGQCARAAVLGLNVDGEMIPLDPNQADERRVYDETIDQRRPVLIRIVNVGTQAVFWSENLGQCTANLWNDVMQADSVGGATPAGDGEAIEFRAHIPKNIYLYAAAAAAVRVTKRYAE